MFILIFEDGSMQLEKKLSEGDLDAADNGTLDLIDISKHEAPTRYELGEWVPISDQ